MPSIASQQLDSIHAMLGAGQRSLRLERHSLILWGTSFGGLALVSNHLLTADQIPDPATRAMAWLGLMTLLLGAVSLLDWQLTRRAKLARDELWSFVHRQVLKVWWLLLSAGVLGTFATFFYGGAYLIFPLWLVLVGLGLYVHGLFSEQTVEWVGGLLIALGVCSVLFRLDAQSLQYLAAAAFGLGMPLLALLQGRRQATSAPFWLRGAKLLLWLGVVLIPPLLAQRLADAQQPAAAPLQTLQEYTRNPLTRQTVLLPAGLSIPVHVEVSGDAFSPSASSVLPLILKRPVEVLVEHGRPTGQWRYPTGPWQHEGYPTALLIPWMRATLQPGIGPQLQVGLVVNMTARAPS